MDFIRGCIDRHEMFFMWMNYIELVVGILFCVLVYLPVFQRQCRKVMTFVLCVIYAGGTLGTIAGLVVCQNYIGILVGVAAGMIFFSLVTYCLPGGELITGGLIVVFKLLLTVCVGLENQGTIAMFAVTFILAALAGVVMSKQSQEWKSRLWIILCSIWGTLEISGGIVGIYYNDITLMKKFLYMEEECINFFTYILKTDLTITSHQSVFVLLIIFLVFLQLPFVYWKVVRGSRVDSNSHRKAVSSEK